MARRIEQKSHKLKITHLKLITVDVTPTHCKLNLVNIKAITITTVYQPGNKY